MSTQLKIEELVAGFQSAAHKARRFAEKQGRPAYVVLGCKAQVTADFPGVYAHRVHANGMVDCCVIEPLPSRTQSCNTKK